MGGYSNFYSNVCMLLGTLKRGVTHRCDAVSLPLSKAGLELARALRTLGVLSDVTVFQKAARMRGGHQRVWPPGAQPGAAADAAGFPAMYMRLRLEWRRGAPAFAPPGAAGALAAPLTFTAATPGTVDIISRPTAQRRVGVRELLSARAAAPPGLFLLSTPQGLMTDVEAELAGTGGVLLAHLGLPLPHVLRVRGALRRKHADEAAAAAAAAAEGRPAPPRAPLAEWDLAGCVAAAVAPRLHGEEARGQAYAVLDGLEAHEAEQASVVRGLQGRLRQLALEQAAWAARRQLAGGGGGGGGEGEAGGSGSGRLPPPAARFGDGGRRFGDNDGRRGGGAGGRRFGDGDGGRGGGDRGRGGRR
ncbi:hypothetical protein Rsub_08485 [Raphidocelis subcapitata]|uniref:Uncharacterized protein n=1 Tax=Raphidocelis subcapitata TaxID=307507 RepID=A0A2V0P7P7_9CHLO|nr:hypothetical protein Rsub_08485 [Raphidocelis subcapitata]|eukprot:GBF95894.1 hypothetical protein Rsub_08485 [Raphidocelis subcapitata]